MGQSKFGEASGWNAMKDKAIGQAKESPGGKMGFGGIGKGLAAGMITRKQDDSKGFAGEEQGQGMSGKMQGRGLGGLVKGPMRMAGLFGGLFGRGKGRSKKRFGLF